MLVKPHLEICFRQDPQELLPGGCSGIDDRMLKKKKILTQPLCFLPAAVLRISVVSLLAEDMLSFGKMNTTGHSLPVPIMLGPLLPPSKRTQSSDWRQVLLLMRKR